MSKQAQQFGPYNPDLTVQQLRATIIERNAEIARIRAERKSRLIETAPRDGTRIFLWWPLPPPPTEAPDAL